MKKGKKKTTLLLCLLYVAVLSAATYAWFSVSNKPKVNNLALRCIGPGDLLIADDLGGRPGEYGDKLDLKNATQSPYAMEEVELRPVTTTDVQTFYAPVYNGDRVVDTEAITDQSILHHIYVYKKTCYLKAGVIKDGVEAKAGPVARKYDIMLLGGQQANEDDSGCVIKESTGAAGGTETAVNALRIAFLVDDGQNEPKVYEPNSAQHNTGILAINALDGRYGGYRTLQQPTAGGDFIGGDGHNSEKLFTIRENVDVKVTMLIWIEGTDDDCTNSIQMDEIMGNIQFISDDSLDVD